MRRFQHVEGARRRRTRFEQDPFDREVRLAKLKEQVPGLGGGGGRMRTLALGGSLVTLMIVATLYYAVNAMENRERARQARAIEVEMAAEVTESPTQQLLAQLEAERAAEERAAAAQLEALKTVDLLEGDDSQRLNRADQAPD